jgi:hypothetical protein
MQFYFQLNWFKVKQNDYTLVVDLRECETTEFKCTNGQCIPANKRCDSRKDCYDGSDEFSCGIVNFFYVDERQKSN